MAFSAGPIEIPPSWLKRLFTQLAAPPRPSAVKSCMENQSRRLARGRENGGSSSWQSNSPKRRPAPRQSLWLPRQCHQRPLLRRKRRMPRLKLPKNPPGKRPVRRRNQMRRRNPHCLISARRSSGRQLQGLAISPGCLAGCAQLDNLGGQLN